MTLIDKLLGRKARPNTNKLGDEPPRLRRIHPFYLRPSRKVANAVVVGIEGEDGPRRAVLVRLLDNGDVRVRTLNGDPSEPSSVARTQELAHISTASLTPDTL